MSEKYLGLIGPEGSVYLRLIQREAEKAGLPVLRVSQRDERCGCYVIDSEAGDVDIWLTEEEDIDCVQHPGMSCVAEAALRYIHRMCMPLSVVGLIGRRHAVQGLGEALVRSGHAVLPCNRAIHPGRALYGAQIFVNSAPRADRDLLDAVWQGRHRIIDISGSLVELTQRFDWKGVYISRARSARRTWRSCWIGRRRCCLDDRGNADQ